jgi:chromosome transmission fidelity protein 1
MLSLKYQLLNPSDSFSDFGTARSVVIAGGTMAPLSDFATQLLSYLPPAHIKNLSCAHVVAPTNILARTLGAGPTGHKLEYKYDARADTKMTDEYGATLLNVCGIVKKGIVCFVPSYRALDSFMSRWQSTGLLGKLKVRKEVRATPLRDTRSLT